MLAAERYGFDFVLSMIKLRGFGGESELWNHNLESFTLMAGLASITSRIKLFATVPTLAIPPAIAARMVSTIDSISNGRFGLNVITGWQRPEYSQMGLSPGDEYFGRRYDYAGQYVQVLRDLWETGVSNFKGEFFKMDDCRLSPRPQADMKLICAGQSDAGMAFTAKYADYNFCFGKGFNTPTACAPTVERMQAVAAARQVLDLLDQVVGSAVERPPRAAVEQRTLAVMPVVRLTEDRLATAAIEAMAAGRVPRADDVVARLHQGDVATDRLDDAGALVAQDGRQRPGELALDDFQVGMAEATRLVAHQHVGRLQLRHRHLAHHQRTAYLFEDGRLEAHQFARAAGALRSRTFSAPA